MASILVIEDDEGVRGLLRLWLEEAGHTVWETTNGRDGTREFRKRPIDLIRLGLVRNRPAWKIPTKRFPSHVPPLVNLLLGEHTKCYPSGVFYFG